MAALAATIGVGVGIGVAIGIVIRNHDEPMNLRIEINSEPIAIPTAIPNPTLGVAANRPAMRSLFPTRETVGLGRLLILYGFLMRPEGPSLNRSGLQAGIRMAENRAPKARHLMMRFRLECRAFSAHAIEISNPGLRAGAIT